MTTISRLEKIERNRLRKDDSYFRPLPDVKQYRRLTVWDHITRISLFVICFLVGLALGYVLFSGLFFYSIKIVEGLK